MEAKSNRQLRTPKLRHHKASGRAYVVLNKRAIYLGDYGTEKAQEKYRKTIAEWFDDPRSYVAVDDGVVVVKCELMQSGYTVTAADNITIDLGTEWFAFALLSTAYLFTDYNCTVSSDPCNSANWRQPLRCPSSSR